MTVPSATSRTNEAAERLRGLAVYVEKYDLDMVPVYEGGVNLLDAALSEERRRAVERIKERLTLQAVKDARGEWCEVYDAATVDAALDEVAR